MKKLLIMRNKTVKFFGTHNKERRLDELNVHRTYRRYKKQRKTEESRVFIVGGGLKVSGCMNKNLYTKSYSHYFHRWCQMILWGGVNSPTLVTQVANNLLDKFE